ncbi:hypothetical protein, partial [Roseibium sediminicola]
DQAPQEARSPKPRTKTQILTPKQNQKKPARYKPAGFLTFGGGEPRQCALVRKQSRMKKIVCWTVKTKESAVVAAI